MHSALKQCDPHSTSIIIYPTAAVGWGEKVINNQGNSGGSVMTRWLKGGGRKLSQSQPQDYLGINLHPAAYFPPERTRVGNFQNWIIPFLPSLEIWDLGISTLFDFGLTRHTVQKDQSSGESESEPAISNVNARCDEISENFQWHSIVFLLVCLLLLLGNSVVTRMVPPGG